jgi:ubiquinone biosynthesis UbiH/UbiF/VisC/COQ6 family hydroxylase
MNYDIIVVGAGPAGLSFARCLKHSGLRLGIIEKLAEDDLTAPEFDGRDVALTHQSLRILRELGVWERFTEDERPPIREAKVLDGDSPYSLDFDADGDTIDVLGHIVSNHVIRRALYEEARTLDNVEFLTEREVRDVRIQPDSASVLLTDGNTLSARLVVAADSRFSATRRMVGIAASMHDFGRVCIVSRMQHEKPHDGIAYECFHYDRTLAVLPLTSHESSIVVTANMERRNAIMDLEPGEFAEDIEARFRHRYGEMCLTTNRFAYPLVGVHAERFCTNRFALVGDAAVGMHPVTAHGYNLGLSGAEILAREITRAAGSNVDFGQRNVLERYQRKHMRTTRPMYHGTNEIVRFFTDDRKPVRLARKLVLRFSNNFPPIRRAIRARLTDAGNGILRRRQSRPS